MNKFNSFLGDVIITSSTDRDSEGTTFAMIAGVEIKDGGLTVNLRDYSRDYNGVTRSCTEKKRFSY